MENKLKRSVRNSKLKIDRDKREYLTYEANGLVPCTLEETEEEVVFVFDTRSLSPFEEVQKKTQQEKFRLLVNASGLYERFEEYEFSLSPSNLMVDINMNPKVLVRDLQIGDQEGFLPMYKALIGCVLAPKYQYKDYLEGGAGLFKKQGVLTAVEKLGSVEEVRDFLEEQYRQAELKFQNTKTIISKSKASRNKVLIPVLAVLLIACGAFAYKLFFIDTPFQEKLLEANSYYLQDNYMGVQQTLESIAVNQLPTDSKYILTRSYIITEGLTDEQKENNLVNITFKTDPILFDYWIYLGRLDFNQAIDVAQRLGDDDLLLFAYMKQQVVVKNDTALSGEEKSTKVEQLQERIDKLLQERVEGEKKETSTQKKPANGTDNKNNASNTSQNDNKNQGGA